MRKKVYQLENRIPDATTLIHINQYTTQINKVWKKIGYVNKKILEWFSDY